MMSKEEYSKENLLSALQSLNCSRNCSTCKYYSPDDIQKCQEPTPYAVDLLEKFIEEYFEPQPYKLEDLKPDMWVWDSYWEECFEIGELYKKKNELDILIHDNNINKKRYETIKFEENRFYPVQMANLMEVIK